MTVAADYGYTHRAIVREVTANGVIVEIPALAPNAPWGPIPTTVPDLAPDEAVLVTQISTSRDTLVVVGRVPGRTPTVAEIVGLASTITALQAADTALQAADTALDTRLDAAEANLTTLNAHSHTTAASMTIAGNASVGGTLGVTGLASLVAATVTGTFTASGTIADQTGIGGSRVRCQTAAQNRNNQTAFLSSTYLTWPVLANAWYWLESQLIYSSSTVADCKFKLLPPTGSGLRLSPWFSDATQDAGNAPIWHDAFDGFEFIAGGRGAGLLTACRPGGLLIVGPTPGDFVVQFAQNTAEVSWTYLELGSTARLTRVA